MLLAGCSARATMSPVGPGAHRAASAVWMVGWTARSARSVNPAGGAIRLPCGPSMVASMTRVVPATGTSNDGTEIRLLSPLSRPELKAATGSSVSTPE